MTAINLRHAGDYIRTGRAPRILLTLLRRVQAIFDFTQERTNRLKRFVRVVRAYKAGIPIKKIEDDYGCCRGTVLRYARLAGLPKRPRGFEPDVRRATISLYKDGVPIAQIQAQLGVSQAYISKTATEEGINRRNFKRRAA